MPLGSEHKHHIKIEDTQLDLGSDPYGYNEEINDDFEGKLQHAQQQLEVLQQQREELERQKAEIDQLNRRKEEFVNGQIEITEKLSGSLVSIDRELFEMRQELEDLEQTRQAFAGHLDRVEKIEPEAWPHDTLKQELNRALGILDQAEDEFEAAVAHFSGGRSRGIFGVSSASPTRAKTTKTPSEFSSMMKNGFAFNLPVVLLGFIALLAYLLK
ncbi:MAG: hypothetical protein HKN82_12685 [Akkermansiaceae bacterium]|nr:hypothetical protein [Akkermansiaceae bacterium]